MKRRTSVFLDDQILRQAQRAARQEGVSFAKVVREALAVYVAGPRTATAVPSFAGKFSSGSSDTSQRVDKLLWSDPHG